MKRKYKFWTGTDMLTERFFINCDGTVWAWVDHRMTDSFALKGELIESVGIPDKDGNDIYVGDKLNNEWQIHFYRGMFVAVKIGETPNMDNSYQIFWIVSTYDACVTGTIYQTTELINQ